MKEIILDYLPTAKIFSIQAHKKGPIHAILEIKSEINKNNPIIVGEAGVGKTAIVEGLALKIAQGVVSDALKGVELHSLDLGALKAGASMTGCWQITPESALRSFSTASLLKAFQVSPTTSELR